MSRFVVIPDTQVKPGINLDYLSWIGKYVARSGADTVVMLGDFADMPSLSSYDKGTKAFEGRRYKADIDAVHRGMEKLLTPILQVPAQPEMVMLYGNHEERILRAINKQPELEGLISYDDLRYDEHWQTVPFLQVKVINEIAFSHFFASGVMGRPVTTARMLLTKKHMSCVAGHQQSIDIATSYRGDGKRLTAIIAGSAYVHEEDYLSPQTNRHWRGIITLNDVKPRGEFDPMPISMDYLKRKFK